MRVLVKPATRVGLTWGALEAARALQVKILEDPGYTATGETTDLVSAITCLIPVGLPNDRQTMSLELLALHEPGYKNKNCGSTRQFLRFRDS